ncbi:MAG TPA: M15 family metallopeptidase [Anaeromyxobacteraceae bacterium]|nr:M15 family metallopeptidase [Anaeromyxobacteraceae bacterium]
MRAAGLAALLVLSGAPSLVDVSARIPDAVLDLRYATPHNFLGRAVYPAGARCLLEAPVADRLARAAAHLREQGLRLVLWDCYRPLSVQREMWKLVPRPGYVADPAKGSNHNRGAAVDVSLAGPDGGPVPLPTEFDTFSAAAHARAKDVPDPARKNRDRLRAAMEAEGFRVNPMEWWHFDAPEARGAPVLDVPLAPREAAR